MNLLSEACAAVCTPKYPGITNREGPIKTGLRFGRRIPSPSRHDLLPPCVEYGQTRNGTESLDRIESGKSSQTLGATTPKALVPVEVLVQRSQIRLREAERTALPGM